MPEGFDKWLDERFSGLEDRVKRVEVQNWLVLGALVLAGVAVLFER